jgi:regulatory protein
VLGKLTAQARTRHELAETLKQRNISEDVARNVLDRMEEVGLVDDAEFARSWVASRQRRRRLSKRALSVELSRKGVDRELADAALERVESQDEYAAACDLAQSKASSLEGLDWAVQYRRLAGALARRGFGAEVSRQVIGEVLNRRRDDTTP